MDLIIHPKIKALLPDLKPEEYATLEESILCEGVREALIVWNRTLDVTETNARYDGICKEDSCSYYMVPIDEWVAGDGNWECPGCGYGIAPMATELVLVDGHNRYEICKKHNIKFETIERLYESLEAAQDWVDQNQIGKRNLSPDALGMAIGRRYQRKKKQGERTDLTSGKSCTKLPTTSEKLAAEHGISPRTVKNYGKLALEVEADPELQEAIRTNVPLKKAKKDRKQRQRNAERKQMAETVQAIPKNDRWNIETADIRTYQIKQRFDFIITDPPYPKEFLDCYDILAQRAIDWLKPQGLLIVMVGQSYLNKITQAMDKYMAYYWTGCYLTPGQPTPLRQRQVNTTWKPILIYSLPGQNYIGKIFGDVWISDHNDKEHHKWGQSISGMLSLVKQICLPGQSIFDPFCGAGTTGVAALIHGCLFSGIDIDEQSINISKARLVDIQKDESND